jgi:hypothetical protein
MTRAERALRAFNALRSAGQADTKSLRALCRESPVMLQQAGAAQAIAFWRRDKSGKEFTDVLANAAHTGEGAPPNGANLFEQLVRADAATYRNRSRALVDAAMWLRKIAQVELAGE